MPKITKSIVEINGKTEEEFRSSPLQTSFDNQHKSWEVETDFLANSKLDPNLVRVLRYQYAMLCTLPGYRKWLNMNKRCLQSSEDVCKPLDTDQISDCLQLHNRQSDSAEFDTALFHSPVKTPHIHKLLKKKEADYYVLNPKAFDGPINVFPDCLMGYSPKKNSST